MTPERWLIVKQIALEVRPGTAPSLAYAVLPGVGTFPTEELAQIGLEGLADYIGSVRASLGWVVMPLSDLLLQTSDDPGSTP